MTSLPAAPSVDAPDADTPGANTPVDDVAGATPLAQALPPLVLLHGLFSSPQEFGLIAFTLRSRGVTLHTPVVEGFSAGQSIRSRHWQDWVDAAQRAVDACVPANTPIVIGGLCAGGVLAACLALQGRRAIAGLVMMSPTFDYDGWGLTRWTKWRHPAYLLGLDRFISIEEREPYGIKNEKIRNWVANEMAQRADSAVGPAKLPLWGIHETERMMAHVRRRASELTGRILVMHAREDEICSLDAVQRLMRELGSQDAELVELENSYHMITVDNDRHRVTDELLRFVGVPCKSSNRPIIAANSSREEAA
jgi:carboxylesterase